MSQRSDQVAEELRRIISMILLDDLSDPRMGFVTITRIELTEDLRYARVYYSVLGDEARQTETEEALMDNKRFIKKLAVERINMKYAMEIKFERDKSVEHSFQIDSILKKIRNENKNK